MYTKKQLDDIVNGFIELVGNIDESTIANVLADIDRQEIISIEFERCKPMSRFNSRLPQVMPLYCRPRSNGECTAS